MAWTQDSAYELYFSTGAYSLRYPTPNSRTLSLILRHARHSRSILDFGCGNGRYIPALLASTAATVTAYDTSLAALQELRSRVLESQHRDRLHIVHGVRPELDAYAPFDLIVCMFGTLLHIAPRSVRIATLKFFAEALSDSKDAKLIVSVPNAYRRFFWHQLNSLREKTSNSDGSDLPKERGDIYYYREMAGAKVLMRYHLYTSASFKADLAEAGLRLVELLAESVLPESAVTRSKLLGVCDRAVSSLVPASAGYGLLAVASR